MSTDLVWHSVNDAKPPLGHRVMTKIDDANGCSNLQILTPKQRNPDCRVMWFMDDGMYVYYEPTHWARILQ